MRQTLCADIAKLTEELVEAKLLAAQESERCEASRRPAPPLPPPPHPPPPSSPPPPLLFLHLRLHRISPLPLQSLEGRLRRAADKQRAVALRMTELEVSSAQKQPQLLALALALTLTLT